MTTKQLPIAGLILAVFFGAGTGTRSDSRGQSRPAPSNVERSYSSKEGRRAAGSPKASPSQSDSDCGEPAATPEFEKAHWWLSPRSPKSCSLSLAPAWREICKINNVRHGDDDLLAPSLTGEEFIPKCIGQSAAVSSMMAAVPNPRRTHLGLMTDRAIEAIQVAVIEAGFLPLSHYLPWPSPVSGSGSSAVSAESQEQSDSPDPGVLIFRDLRQRKNLVILLIPELPTEGLDRKVFSSAWAMMKKLSPDTGKIWFAGPNFSGSVASLWALEEEIGPAKCINAFSGSITNPPDPDKKQVHCSTLTLMQAGDPAALGEFVAGVGGFGYHGHQIAILSEEGTEYGVQFKHGPAGLVFLHFPREISKLRNAYGAEAGKSTPTESMPPTGLGLQWQDSEAAQRDDLQTYGGRQTPLSQETVLSSLAITLKAEGIKALGILATDPLDEAFLIHSLKKSSPDVRLFLRDPDLLFLRTPDVGSLTGTLLVSNYPLIPQNQFWSSPKEQRQRLITFPSAFQEGEYNAVVELIKNAGLAPGTNMKRLEWDWPAGRDARQDASKSGKQPLWLATIGTAGHYPIKILNDKDVPEAGLKLHSLELGPPLFLPFVFWSFIAVLGVVHVIGLKLHGAVPSYFKHDFDLSDKTNIVTLVKMSCHMMAIVTSALAQLILGSSYLFFYRSSWRYVLLAGAVLSVTAFLLWGIWNQGYVLYVAHRQQEQLAVPDERSKIISPKRIFRSSVIVMSIMVGAGLFWALITIQARFGNAFLHFRDLNLSSGVAPTLPLASVLMVLYFGVWAYVRRLSYWEHRYVEMANLKLDQVVRRDLGMDVRAIDACLLGPLENGKWMMGFWLVLGVCILTFRPWETLDMIEPSGVRWFILFFFSLALLTLWLNWFRFINIWVHLRNILEYLENLPIRVAFTRLPREKSLPILQWNSSQSTFLLRQVLDRLRALATVDATDENVALKNQFESRIDALMKHGVIETEVVQYRKVVGGSPRSTLRAFSRSREELVREAREEMTKLIDILSARLLTEYWRRGSSGTKQDQEPPPADLKYLLAEDIVALPFYAYVRRVMSELRNILFFLGIAVSLLFAALHTYAFRSDQAIDWWFFGLFAFMGGGIVIVVAQMERNALLSRLSDGTPGALGTGFYLQLLKYGTVPFVTIFGSQVPSISNLVLKWVQPALEALH